MVERAIQKPSDKAKDLFYRRLFLNVSGNTKRDIYEFIYLLEKVFKPTQLTLSPIIPNKKTEGFHCFINVLLDTEKPSGGTESQ